MRLRTHLLFGAGISALLGVLFLGNDTLLPIFVLLGSLSAVIPDMDVIVSVACSRLHRTAATHSMGASLMIALVMTLMLTAFEMLGFFEMSSVQCASAFTICFSAAFTHTSLDSLTVSGTTLFWPFSGRRYRGSFRYDSFSLNASISFLGLAMLAIALMIAPE